MSDAYYRAKMGETPSKQLANRLQRIKDRYGMEPEDYVRLLVNNKFSTNRIAKTLRIHFDSLRIFMVRHGIEPCKDPQHFAASDHRDNLKLVGRRASPKNNLMVDGKPFVTLMAERGHCPATPVYTRTRRRMAWGWDFQSAYADAVSGPRNAMHGKKPSR